jgi:AcrR family transcriptional regulator
MPTAERQVEIAAAALHLAREISPPLITTAEIAAAVGVSQGAVFKHFPTKDAIWHAAMAWVKVQLLSSLEAAAQSADSPLDALRAVFRTHASFVLTHPGVPRFIFHELQQPLDSPVKLEVRALLQAYRKLVLRLLDAGVRSGEVAATVDRDAAATLFLGVVQGLVMQSMAAGRAAPLKSQAEPVLAIYLRGISAMRDES